jgi:hypothetical protein
MFGDDGQEFDMFAFIDKETEENWISLADLKKLGLSYKTAHRSQQTHWIKIGNEKVQSLGEVTLVWSLPTAGSKIFSFQFQVYKHTLPRVILALKLFEKAEAGYLTRATFSPIVRYKRVKLLLISWEAEGKLRCEDEVNSLQSAFWSRLSVNGELSCIPSSDSSAATKACVARFANGCTSADLLIVYYAGHGTDRHGLVLAQ